jgi:uncharacterized RDD family membrane protein YckC
MNDVRYGGFFRRTAAFLADQVVLAVLYGIVFFIGVRILGIDGVSWFTLSDSIEEEGGFRLFAAYEGMTLVLNMAYFTYFHGTIGRTPGKRLFGLRVLRTDGRPVTPGPAFLRWAGYLVSFLPFLAGFLWIAVDRRKQGWHDKIAGTVVVREKKREVLAATEAEWVVSTP